jgi:hypothetical protein
MTNLTEKTIDIFGTFTEDTFYTRSVRNYDFSLLTGESVTLRNNEGDTRKATVDSIDASWNATFILN